MSTNSSPPPTPTTPSFSYPSYTMQQRTRSTLPAECLVMIFNYLDQDRSTLHALLRVNHQFFQLTIPILYRSPFRLLESRAEAWSWSERTQRQVHLLQLFMHVVQIKQIDRHEATTAAAAAAAIKASTRTGTQRKWRHPQSHDPHSDYVTANPMTIAVTTSALSSPTGSSSSSNGIAMDRGQSGDDAKQQQQLQEQRQQPPQIDRRQRKILRFKSGTQPWWTRRRPYFSASSSSSTTTTVTATASSSLSSSSSSSSSFSFSSNWTFSSPSSSYSSSSSAFSAFFGSKKESNVPLVPGNIQEAAACLQQDEPIPLSITADNQRHLLHYQPTLTTTPTVAITDDNNKDKYNNPVHHTTYLNYPIARSKDIITNNNNNDSVIDCGQHRSHRWSEPPQQTDLCLRYYFDPDDSPSPSPSQQHNNNNNNDNNNKHIRFGDRSGHSSGNPFTDTDHHDHHRQLYSDTYIDSDDDSLEGNDSYDDDDNDDEYGTNRTLVDTTTTFSPWCGSSLEPDLGPFNAQPDKTTSSNWTRALQQRLRCMTGLGVKEATSQEQQRSASSTSEGVMADYLQHYVDQSHPGLVRILPFVFPTLPAEAFDQLSYSRAMIPTATPLPGHRGSVSPSTSHSVLNIFNTLQPSHGSNLERAQSIRVGVERDLLHHSPNRINTIAVSVSRLPAIMSLPQRQSTPSSPSPRRGTSMQSATTATGGLHSTAVSSLTSLFSFLSSSPFSTSPLSNMPTATSSSSSLSSLQSTQSSCSTTSSSSSVSSTHTDSWTGTNRFSRLRHLTRIEFHDIHHKFDEEAVVDFLTSHSRTYDTIREVKIGGPNDIGKSTAPRVVRILSCLRKVKVLDMTEWREAIKYLDMIPTQHLETLLLGNVRMTNNPTEISEMEQQQQQQQQQHQQHSYAVDDEQQHKEDPQILALQQCRRLRELRMPVLVDGLFEWAVQERQIRLGSFSRPSLSWSSSSELPYWVDGPSPVQLENVHLSGSSTGPLISTLLHVVDAFRDSLKVLQSTSWIDSTETGSCSQSLAWTWCLPNLQVLDLQGEIAYRFKIQSLESCPQLRVLRLTLPQCFLPSSSYSSSSSTAGGAPVGLTALTAELEVSAGQPSSSSGPSNRLCACHRRDLHQRQLRQQRHLSLADVLGDDDADDSECTCHAPNISNSTNNNPSPSYIGQDRHRHRHDLFPRLEELKLVGDWGLTNESLLGIAKKMPRLERLSLLRCESDKLTALGLIRAMPSLRGDVVNGDDYAGGGGYSSCRVRWMEICKSWQCEIGAAIEYDDGCCEGESDCDRRRNGEMYMAFVAAVKGGICPLHIEYQY
ncbi:hypothetical protein F5H01DRAFT_86574 [Linnemannia elongata]|nr:hypothetical protein F5H01DRAFT_86574 [Linnemannia elongata]